MAVWWTKTSSPFSRLRNPKPLASLNHLTVPCSIWCCSFKYDLPRTQCGSLRVGGNRNRQKLQIEFYDYTECSTDSANSQHKWLQAANLNLLQIGEPLHQLLHSVPIE